MGFRRSRTTGRDAVVFVANDIAGLLHHRKHLIERAIKTGAHPILVGDTSQAVHEMPFEHRYIPIERFKLHLSDLFLFFGVLSVLLRTQPRVLHLISIKPYLYGGLAAQLSRLFGWRGNVVITVPGLGRLYDIQADSIRELLRRYVVEWSLRIAVRNATVSFETSSDRDFWIARGNVSSERTVVTRGTGIDLEKFAPPVENRKNERLRVLYAGRLLRSKGLDIFLNAASMNRNPGVQMFVAGRDEPKDPDGISADELSAHPGIVFLGTISDMPALLGEIDVVVLPSRYNEGIPRILLEAAACGCVAIATCFPGSLELIEEGKTGYFLHAREPGEQADELIRLLQDIHHDGERRARVGANAADYGLRTILKPAIQRLQHEGLNVSARFADRQDHFIPHREMPSYYELPGVSRTFSRVPVHKTPEIYRSCDLLVKLSTVEGMFGPPLEMFHCGGTAVVLNVTGHEEYILHQHNALVVSHRAPENVVDALRQLLGDRERLEALKQGARQTALEWPDWASSSAAFSDWIEMVLQSPGTNREAMAEHIRSAWKTYDCTERQRLESNPAIVWGHRLKRSAMCLPRAHQDRIAGALAIAEAALPPRRII